MKKVWSFTLILCAMVYSSCHKSNSSGSSSNSGYYVSSAVSISAGTRVIDSFQYDNSNRISQFLQIKYDTTTGTPSETTLSVGFEMGATGLPTGYLWSIGSGTLGTSVEHKLTFDNQNRIIKDTCPTTGFVTYFSYPNGNIAATVLYGGTGLNNQIDTLYLSGGNAATINTWMPNDAQTADSLQGSLKFGYSGVANPMYHSSITSSIGPLLYIIAENGLGGGLDPVSQNAPSSFSGNIDGLPEGLTINFSQTKDSKGRLSVLSASLLGIGETIYFNYY